MGVELTAPAIEKFSLQVQVGIGSHDSKEPNTQAVTTVGEEPAV
jgi:hypothetical protein